MNNVPSTLQSRLVLWKQAKDRINAANRPKPLAATIAWMFSRGLPQGWGDKI